MKILLINNRHFRGGGADVVYFSTGELLKAAGHQVVYFSRQSINATPDDYDSFFIPDKSNYGLLSRISRYFNNTDAAKKLEELLMIEHFDIAHVHLMWGGMTASIIPVLHRYGIPVVHTVHDYRMVCPAYTFRNGMGEVCEKCKGGHFMECFKGRCSKGSLAQSALMTAEMYYRNRKWHPAKELDGVLYVSKFAKQKHEEFDEKFKMVKNIVLYNFTKVGDNYPPVEKDAGYYLFYGRLSHEKGIATLVEVFSKHPELKLKVVGTGPKENELRNQNFSNVEFLGYKTGGELYDIVRNARFVCVPSEWYENNPMTIVEAYSMGVPVIGANIGGIPEIIEEGHTGFLFKSGDVTSLEKAICQSLAIGENVYQQMKKYALTFAKGNFDSHKYYEQLLGFYKQFVTE